MSRDHDCDCRCHIIEIESITVTTGTEFILVADPITVRNGECYTLRICQHLPVVGESGIEPVFIQISGTNYPVLDRIGNVLLAGRLRGKHRYRVVFGDNTNHFLMFDPCFCMTYNANPTIPSESTDNEGEAD